MTQLSRSGYLAGAWNWFRGVVGDVQSSVFTHVG